MNANKSNLSGEKAEIKIRGNLDQNNITLYTILDIYSMK